MSAFTKRAVDVWAGYDAAGHERQVIPHDAQVWGTEVERALAAFQAGGGVIFQSKSEADAALNYPPFTQAWVFDDDPNLAGIYQKQGASGSGSWLKTGDLPYSFIRATNTNSGDPNAITADTDVPIPVADGGALISLNIVAENAADAPTVSFNGGAPLTITDAVGTPISAGGLSAGMLINGYKVGTTFRVDLGPRGWSPLLRTVQDGERRVHELYDWTGGHGAKPEEKGYLGPNGLTDNIAEATDIRGPQGPNGPGTGDMLKSNYDPRLIEGDAFDAGNHTGRPTWLPKNVAALIANAVGLGYAAATPALTVVPGDILVTQEEGFAYEVADSGASDEDLTITGGVKLYAIPGSDGFYEYAQLGAVLDGTTDNSAIHQKAVDRGYPLAHRTDGVLYIASPAVTASTLWQFKGQSNGAANWSIDDNPARVLCPNGFVRSADATVRAKVVSDGMAFVGGEDVDTTAVIFDDGHRETTLNLQGGLEFHLTRNVFWYCDIAANAYNCWNSVARNNYFQSGGTFIVPTVANDVDIAENLFISSKSFVRWGHIRSANYNCNIERNQINVSARYTGTEIPLAVNFRDNYLETWILPPINYVVKIRALSGINLNGEFVGNTMQDTLNSCWMFLVENEHTSFMTAAVVFDNNELRVGGLGIVRMGDSTIERPIAGIVMGSGNRTSASNVPILSYPKTQPVNVGDYSFIVENVGGLSVASNVAIPFPVSSWGVPAPQINGDTNSTFFQFAGGVYDIQLECDISYTNNVNDTASLSFVDGGDQTIKNVTFSMIGDGSTRRKTVRLNWTGAIPSLAVRRFRINADSPGATLVRATLKVMMLKDTSRYIAR